MKNDIRNKLVDYAKANDSIETIFFLKDENYDSFNHVYTIVNDVIVGKLEEELVSLFDDVILVNRTKDEFVVDKNKTSYTSINIYKKDNIKLTESIIAEEFADAFFGTLPGSVEFIYTKPGFSRMETGEIFRYEKPKEYEFTSTIKNFFATAYEASLYIDERDDIAACLKMDELRKYLVALLDFYVRDKYSYTMDIGSDGQKLINTLEIDLKEDFLLTFHHEDLMDIYQSLFKACVLFRRVAMELAEKFDYPYPREIDVETLKILRNNYKRLESFLS